VQSDNKRSVGRVRAKFTMTLITLSFVGTTKYGRFMVKCYVDNVVKISIEVDIYF
jgi:hypothetical protein